jgi:hypothetical protein
MRIFEVVPGSMTTGEGDLIMYATAGYCAVIIGVSSL